MGVCNCSMYCCTLLYVQSGFAINLMGKRELVVLLSLSSWCLVMVVWLFLVVSWVCLRFVTVLFPDRTHYFWLLSVLVNCVVYGVSVDFVVWDVSVVWVVRDLWYFSRLCGLVYFSGLGVKGCFK